MLIVKGERGKSVLADILMNKTNSICFEYHDYPVLYNSYCVDSDEYSLPNFIEYIAEEFKSFVENEEHYDYLVVYTNKKEEDLKELVDWMNENRCKICCWDIIVMCR